MYMLKLHKLKLLNRENELVVGQDEKKEVGHLFKIAFLHSLNILCRDIAMWFLRCSDWSLAGYHVVARWLYACMIFWSLNMAKFPPFV